MASVESLYEQLGKCKKKIGVLSRMLEGSRLESDLVKNEKLQYTGSTQEFINLIMPLLASEKLKVNGKVNMEATIRVFDEFIEICPHENESPRSFRSVLSQAQRSRSEYEEE